jgi:glycosyltransferase involved in cell wall biosynthesis
MKQPRGLSLASARISLPYRRHPAVSSCLLRPRPKGLEKLNRAVVAARRGRVLAFHHMGSTREHTAAGPSTTKAMTFGIVTPSLNAEEYLEDTLKSIWSQASDRVQIDHVLVDGGSTDRTVEIAKRYPTRVIESTDDQGMYDAVNRGLALVRGDIVGYMNADDEIAPGALEVVGQTLHREDGAGWVCGRVEYIDQHGGVLGAMKPVPLSLRAYLGLGWSCIPQQTVWARREFFDRVGPFDLDYRNCGDYDWYARAMRLEPPAILSQTLGRFRLHPGQISLDPAKMERESRMVRERYDGADRAAWVQGRLLSLRLNLRNPAWLLAKKRGKISFAPPD